MSTLADLIPLIALAAILMGLTAFCMLVSQFLELRHWLRRERRHRERVQRLRREGGNDE